LSKVYKWNWDHRAFLEFLQKRDIEEKVE